MRCSLSQKRGSFWGLQFWNWSNQFCQFKDVHPKSETPFILQNYFDFYPAQHLTGQLVLWNSNLFFWLKSSDQNILKRFAKDSQLVLGSLLSCQPCLGTLICGRWDWLWSISDWELDAGCLGPSAKSGIFAPPPGPAGGNEAELCTRGVGYNLLPPGPGRGLGV